MTVRRLFVPWYRKGFCTALSGEPDVGRSRAALPIRVALSDVATSFDLPVELAGPGDVVGLDPSEILRCEPYDGCSDVEPAYFPYVELASADLPWRFTPSAASEFALADPEQPGLSRLATRLKPWLALVVIEAERAALTPASPGGLPVLTTTGDQLPPPGESWAWAHVQVNLTESTGANLEAELALALADPSRCVTRVVCPRRLAPATRYGAYLVPTFAAGKSVIHPSEVGEDPLGAAWPSSGEVRLPVYFQWSFSTSKPGSFESLARQLRPRLAPGDAAGRSLDTSRPGWGADARPERTTRMQGALRPLDSEEPPPDEVLAESLRAAISLDANEVALLPPIYGQDYQKGVTALTDTAGGWLAQLNTDPRRRFAAGLASWAVAVEQESLVEQAWQQLADAGLPSSATSAARELAALVTDSLQARSPHTSAGAPALLRALRHRGPLRDTRSASMAVPARLGKARKAAGENATTAFAPKFARPAYELLRAIAPEWLLPGVDSIPPNSVVAMCSHAAFVESFLVGLNHALAQELTWRGYPLDRDATMFGNFWSGTAQASAPSLVDWAPDSRLGGHLAEAEQLVLLIRGQFVARFPGATISLSRATGDQGEEHLLPSFSGGIGTDCAFVGFPLTQAQARTPTSGGPWRVVLQEALVHARFGVDDGPETGTSALVSWQDLDWAHPHLAGSSHVAVSGPLVGVTRSVRAGAQDQATWGLSAGHLASALQQSAFRIRIPLSLWLTPEVA